MDISNADDPMIPHNLRKTLISIPSGGVVVLENLGKPNHDGGLPCRGSGGMTAKDGIWPTGKKWQRLIKQ